MFLREVRLRPGAAFAGRDAYLGRMPALRNLYLDVDAPVTCLCGENGTGKSTLLEGIAAACGFNPEGGSRNFHFSTSDSHSSLFEQLVLVRGTKRPRDGFFLRAESFYNVASEIDRLDEEGSFGGRLVDSYGGKSLHDQSHGESFWALMQNRFSGQGLYLLDEPEAALSPTRQLALLERMHQLVKSGSQFLLATHSPILLAYPGARLYELSEEGIRLRQYAELENVRIYKAFLQSPERMLRHLGMED